MSCCCCFQPNCLNYELSWWKTDDKSISKCCFTFLYNTLGEEYFLKCLRLRWHDNKSLLKIVRGNFNNTPENDGLYVGLNLQFMLSSFELRCFTQRRKATLLVLKISRSWTQMLRGLKMSCWCNCCCSHLSFKQIFDFGENFGSYSDDHDSDVTMTSQLTCTLRWNRLEVKMLTLEKFLGASNLKTTSRGFDPFRFQLIQPSADFYLLKMKYYTQNYCLTVKVSGRSKK